MNEINYTNLNNYLKIWLDNKFTILFITLIFAVSSVIYALSLDNKYTSTAYIKVVDSEQSSSLNELASQYSNLANIAGIDLGTQTGKNAEEIIKKIYSREFLNHLLKFEDIKLNIVAAKSFDFQSKQISYDNELYDYKNSKWIREPDTKKNRISEPTYVEVFDDFYMNQISASKDKLSGLIFIAYEHPSPYFAQSFINLIIRELNETERDKDIEDFNKALSYLSEQQNNYTNNQIKKTLSKLEEKYIKLDMLAQSKTDYIVESIDPPFLPEEKSYPARAILCITITLFGFIFSLFIVIFYKVFQSYRKEINV
jgi:LPS O-antigen subunit length determinant protein (WzzB/FepE family)